MKLGKIEEPTSNPGTAATYSTHTTSTASISLNSHEYLYIKMASDKQLSALVLIADGSEEIETVTPLE